MNLSVRKIHLLITCLVSMCFSLFAATISVPDNVSTISAALTKIKKGDTIVVNDGIYKGSIFINSGVTIIAKNLFKSVLDGNGRGTVVTMGNGSAINGFEIRNGTIGVFNNSAGVSISKCLIINNQQTGIMCIGHLPNIIDNIIAFNRGSGIQGWDVQSTSFTINHNTIALNNNHGISIGGNSSIIIENNIIANNNQFGIKTEDKKIKLTLIGNDFYQNAKFSGSLSNDNYSIDPMFKNASKRLFALDKESKCIGKASDNQDIGARITY